MEIRKFFKEVLGLKSGFSKDSTDKTPKDGYGKYPEEENNETMNKYKFQWVENGQWNVCYLEAKKKKEAEGVFFAINFWLKKKHVSVVKVDPDFEQRYSARDMAAFGAWCARNNKNVIGLAKNVLVLWESMRKDGEPYPGE